MAYSKKYGLVMGLNVQKILFWAETLWCLQKTRIHMEYGTCVVIWCTRIVLKVEDIEELCSMCKNCVQQWATDDMLVENKNICKCSLQDHDRMACKILQMICW